MSWRNWFRRQRVIHHQILTVRGEPIGELDIDHWQGIARMFHLVPGLDHVLQKELDEALQALAGLSAEGADRERVRLVQKVTDLKAFLDMPKVAVRYINAIREQQAKDMARGEKKSQGVSNLMQGA